MIMKCFVAKCNSRSTSKHPVHFFQAPSDPVMLEKWNRNIDRKDKSIAKGNKVCSIHFEDEFILQYFETKLPNGSVFRLKRGRVALRSDAVPTIFPNSPDYKRKARRLARNRRKTHRKVENPKRSVDASSSLTIENIECPTDVLDVCLPTIDSHCSTGGEITFSTNDEDVLFVNVETNDEIVTNGYVEPEAESLLQCLRLMPEIKFPWLFSQSSDGKAVLVRVEESDRYLPVKRVIIDIHLNVQIFIGKVAIRVERYESVREPKDLVELLSILDHMKVCPNSWSPPNERFACLGYIQLRTKSVLCSTCLYVRQLESKRNQRKLPKEKIKIVKCKSKRSLSKTKTQMQFTEKDVCES